MEEQHSSLTQGNSPQPVSIDQMLNAAYKLNDWLNFYWNFYVGFVGVVFGWIFSAKSPWQLEQQLIVTAFFIGFVAISISALVPTYFALNQTILALRGRWGGDAMKDALLSRLAKPFWCVAIVMHLVADGAVLYSIWTFRPVVTCP